ncbi:MAG: hypothetical protein KC613_07360 [Myxococcales bacterium]|nr:hypothetical protein [Myxococcales bacterium]MCB9522156.1 hypothetical protein [Myxococcales bacterium]
MSTNDGSAPERALRPEPKAAEELIVVHPPTPFGPWRAALDHEPNGATLLDLLISPHDAAALIQRLPADDLYGHVLTIGLEDCTELLAMASGEQVRAMLDSEIWVRDELSVERLDPWLTALMHAGPDVLGQRMLDLDDEVLNWILKRSVRAVVIEDPEDFNPPEAEHVTTPDGRLCVVFPEGEPRDLPVKIFLDWLMRQDTELCLNLLLGAEAALDSVLQEEAYRWRTGRMADRGYVDYYEALAIYSPPPRDAVAVRAPVEGAAPHRWIAPLVDAEARLAAAFGALPEDTLDTVQAELAYVANMALSADRVDPWDSEAQAQTLARLRAGLGLGLDALGGGDAARDAAVLAATPLALIFRHGYARMVAVRGPLAAHRKALRLGDDAVGAVDVDALRPWAQALLGERHPQRPGGTPLATPADLAEANIVAGALAELATVAQVSHGTEVGLGARIVTAFARAAVGLQGDGPLPASMLAEAHRALFTRDGAWTDLARASMTAFWSGRGGQRASVRDGVFEQLRAEVGAVRAEAVEPRFVSLLWVDAEG